jgi:hypothetical protein
LEGFFNVRPVKATDDVLGVVIEDQGEIFEGTETAVKFAESTATDVAIVSIPGHLSSEIRISKE